MNLTFFIPDFKGGGAQRMIVNMANEFARRDGCRVSVVVVENTGPYRGDLDAGVRIVDLGKKRVAAALFSMMRYLRAEKPDIVLSALFHVNIVALLAKILTPGLRTKFIVSERNHFSSSIKSLPVRFMVRALYRFADKVVGISRGVAEDISAVAGLRDAQVCWIHNPVVTQDMIEHSGPAPQEDWFDDRSVPVVITSGRLVEQKDYETLLRGFAQLLAMRPARLIILGDGVLREYLEEFVCALEITESVRFVGFVEEPLEYMKRSDLFVISSRWEGFCNVIVEALLCGLPVVATDCPSGPAEILDDGAYGRLVNVGDAQGLAAAMNAALDEEHNAERQKKRAMAFTVQRICDQYEALMRDVLAEGSR